ncbi:MAG: T9SS type A sorting domain-containing protein [Candidatus Eiseniibacteriota bacterium]|nr:MAG: T9SS type A sorting domain-containing protein [Candidatus Eisenbacteria bacterium]
MRLNNRIWGAVLVALVTIVLLPASAAAIVHSFTEDFTTGTYHDPVNTTAWWDSTVGGEIRLWPFGMERVGSCGLTGSPTREVQVAGDYAFVANGSMGLVVVNIQYPDSIFVQGGYVGFGSATGFDIAGDYLFMTNGSSRMFVLDIGDPWDPQFAGAFDTLVAGMDVEVVGNYAYVADATMGLYVLNISNPAVPSTAGYYNTPGTPNSVTISGNYAYVADGAAGVCIVDITDPTSPTFAATYITSDEASTIAISGNHAYIADKYGGLQVADISDPTVPMYAGDWDPMIGYFVGVAVSGDYAYITDRGYGIYAIDIFDPTNPYLVGSYGQGAANAGWLAVAEEYAYVGTNSALWVVDVSDRIPLMPIGNVSLTGHPVGMEVSGDYAYVADTDGNLWVVDVTYPPIPVVEGSLPMALSALDVEVEGDYAYVGLYGGLMAVDISDPALPDSVGFWDNTGGGASWAVAVSGDLAFVGEDMNNKVIHVVDVSDPTSLWEMGFFDIADYVSDAAVHGDYLLLAAQSTGLLIYDITNPVDADSVAQLSTYGFANGVTVYGDFAFVSTSLGFQVIDINDPVNPSLLDTYSTSPDGCFWSVARGDYVFVSTSSGMIVFDVSFPTNIVLADSYTTGNWAGGISVAGDYVFLADRGGDKMEVLQAFQSLFDLERNQGQSLVFFQSDDEISGVKLTPTQVDSVYWYVSSDSGASWTPVPIDAAWHTLDSPGGDLLWRTNHYYRTYWQNPACQNVDIEWRYSFAEVDSVIDVPEDEGGWVRVRFDASGRDAGGGGAGGSPQMSVTAGGAGSVTSYGVHRRIDDVGFIEEILERGHRLGDETPISVDSEGEGFPLPSSLGHSQAYVLDGRYFYVPEHLETGGASVPEYPVSGDLPPGVWEAVNTVPATQQEQYYSLVPTVADSVAALEYTVYCVSAHTTDPLLYFFSPPDSGYSVDNIAPGAPQELAGDYSYPPAELLITWERRGERDFSHYAVYKGPDPDFVPDVENRMGTPWDTFLVDSKFDPNVDNYYKVSAWDIHENESEHSLLGPDGMSGVKETPSVPEVTSLEQNIPNPFNPVTVIRFSIAEAGRVELVVFDVAGRPVRRLAEGARGVDRYEVVWDGRDDAGRTVASGVYIYRLEAPGYKESRKMVLLR